MAQAKSVSSPTRRDLLAIAQQLRVVKAAEKQFLARWARQVAIEGTSAVTCWNKKATDEASGADVEAELLDALDKDWTNLYRGSVLDD